MRPNVRNPDTNNASLLTSKCLRAKYLLLVALVELEQSDCTEKCLQHCCFGGPCLGILRAGETR